MVREISLSLAGAIALLSYCATCQELPSRVSETKIDSLRQQDLAAIRFDKFLDTYQWNGTLAYSKTFGLLSVGLSERYLSTLTRTDRNHTTDQQAIDLSGRYRLNDKLQAASQLTSLIVSDNLGIGVSNLSSTAWYGGFEYQPSSTFSITPLVGMRLENQTDQRDKGISYLLNLASNNLEYNGYKTGIDGRYEYDRLTPRILELRNLGVNSEKVFFERTRNAFRFVYSRNRRDFYSPADDVVRRQFSVVNNIETRSEDAYGVLDSLDYGIGTDMLLSVQGNISTRAIDRETKYRSYSGNGTPVPNTTIQELRIGGGAQATYTPSRRVGVTVQFAYQERDEDHKLQPDDSLSPSNVTTLSRLEDRKNNHSRRTTIASSVDAALSESHSVSLSGSANLLRYDTPDASNTDDRDELWYILNLTTMHRINGHLLLRLSADANLTHIVYISSQRSADNTWNRIFRLAPRLEYSPVEFVSSSNTFEVLANYTAYDFEYPASPIRSFVFRQFGFIDSSSARLTGRLGVEFFGQLRYYERGELQWDAFSERPLNYFEDRTYVATIRYELKHGLLFSVGIRYFSQSRFGYASSERVLENFLRSSGPLTEIRWSVSGRTEFLIRGWYENQTQTGALKRGFVNSTMNLTVHL